MFKQICKGHGVSREGSQDKYKGKFKDTKLEFVT